MIGVHAKLVRSLLEIAISEFHIPRTEFFFEWTLPSFMQLMDLRIERNKASTEKDTEEDKPQYSSLNKLGLMNLP